MFRFRLFYKYFLTSVRVAQAECNLPPHSAWVFSSPYQYIFSSFGVVGFIGGVFCSGCTAGSVRGKANIWERGSYRIFHSILRLGTPLILSQSALMEIGVTDSIMLGWYSVEALAAGVLGHTVSF